MPPTYTVKGTQNQRDNACDKVFALHPAKPWVPYLSPDSLASSKEGQPKSNPQFQCRWLNTLAMKRVKIVDYILCITDTKFFLKKSKLKF